MSVLLVDAFDSFSHIIYQYLLVEGVDVTIVRSGEMTPEEVLRSPHGAIVLGPGPGHPNVSGHVEIVRAVAGQKPVLGVCLGHQAIALAFGADVGPAPHIMHGKTSHLQHNGTGVFANVPESLAATRYHSLAVNDSNFPTRALEITARAEDDGTIMGIRHREHLIEGVQFHPESILTQAGRQMFSNFLREVAT